MATFFIADLHLHASRPNITEAFYSFLKTRARSATSLYILGDLFDAWIGDDNDEALADEVALSLRTFSEQGASVFFQKGNRDFLLGADYANRANMALIPDEMVIDLYGTPTLLMHGDSLCTADESYMQFRRMVRSLEWQTHILQQPLTARKALAAELREKSQSMNSLKASDIMDVTQAEVERVMSHHKVNMLIHGHTHRPDLHTFDMGDKKANRWVLGDWHDKGWCIKAEQGAIQLIDWLL